MKRIETRWDRTRVLEESQAVRDFVVPSDPEQITERVRLRRQGRITPEEAEAIQLIEGADAVARDRRLVGPGVSLGAGGAPPRAPAPLSELLLLRQVLLDEAERDLAAAWDPSIGIGEAVRATEELDATQN